MPKKEHTRKQGQEEGIHTLIVMELLFMVTIKLAQDLDNICISVGASECVSCTIEAENEFSVFARNMHRLSMNTRSSGRTRLRAGRANSGRHLEKY
jgi:hypothetical protein